MFAVVIEFLRCGLEKEMKIKKAFLILLAVVAVVTAGCKSQHPASVTIEPSFNPGEYTSILVAPVISTITRGEDPKRESERIPNRILWEFVSDRYDYKFLSPEQYKTVIAKADLQSRQDQFEKDWSTDHTVDVELLRAVRSELKVDLILLPLVYLWHKDETDYREASAASATQVGMTLTLVDPKTGDIVWEATDENYKESVRSEGDRIQSSTAGIDRRVSGTSVTGGDIYAAPPFDDVTVLVLEALVGAIPERSGATM
jgi:hypothetical protein